MVPTFQYVKAGRGDESALEVSFPAKFHPEGVAADGDDP